MDKYEYRLKSEEIQRLIEEEQYAEAAEIADSIDWRRVKSATMLQKIAALYRVNRRNEDSKEILMLAYDRYPTNRSVLYSLCEVSIELDEVVQAIEFYKEFVRQAPRDNGVFTLRYKILEAQEASLEERIELLEELKKRDYQEEWGYELAYLYHRVGLATKCVEECDDIILWFGDGPIVMQAMELKMLHTPLTKVQQQNYEDMKYKQQLEAEGYATEEDTYSEEYYGQQGDYQDGQYTDNNEVYYEDNYADQTYGAEQYSQEDYGNEQYDAEGYTEEGYDDQYSDSYVEENYEAGNYHSESYTEDGYADEQYASESYAEDGYTDEQYVSESYAEDEYADEQYTSEPYTEEAYQDEQYQSDAYYQEQAYEEQDQDNFSSSVYQQSVQQDDLSQYNTINLQKVVADSMKELYEKDRNLFDTSRDLLQPQHIEEQNHDDNQGQNIYDNEIDQALEETNHSQDYYETEENADASDDNMDASMFTMPEQNPILEKKNTGKMYVDDVLTEWERMKKEAEEKRLEEVRQRVLQQTGSILQNFETAATSGLLAGLEGSSELASLTEDELQEAFEEEQEIQQLESDTHYVEKEEQEEQIEKASEENIEEEKETLQDTILEEDTFTEMAVEEDDAVEEIAEIEETEDSGEVVSYMEAIGDSEEDEEDEALLFQPTIDEIQEAEMQESEETEYYEDEMQESEDAEYYEDEMQESEGAEYYEDEMQAAIEENLKEEEGILKSAKKNLEDVAELSGTLEEEALGQRNSSSKVMMNTAEISSIEQKIIETTQKETSPVKEETRNFTDEEAELFESFAQTKKVKKQIINALDKISLASYTGNVLITGEPGLGTVELAKNILKEVQATDSNFSGKVAKITGEKLNLKNLEQTFQKLNNGALLIEKANGCTEECLYNMSRVLDQEDRGVIVIMEDTRHNIMQLLKKQAMIADYFNIRIDLVEMNNDALVAYAKNYALEQEYSIDELGILALYTRIADIQAGNHVVTVEEVKDIVDEAIWNSKRFKISNFVDVLFAKRKDEDDMIVLRERDFI